MVEMREKRAEREAANAARKAAKEAEANGEAPADSEGDAAAADDAKPNRGGRRPRKPAPTTARTKRARSKT
jgi:hypothetical protein